MIVIGGIETHPEGSLQLKVDSGTCRVGSGANDAGVSSLLDALLRFHPRALSTVSLGARPYRWHFPARSLPREYEWTKAKKHL